MERSDEELMRLTLAAMAPGTELREGLERILRGRTGAIVVLGYDRGVEKICTGGFPINIEFSAARLRELAKMDGAVIIASDLSRIVRAATQMVPDAAIPTSESGTRHRTAERVAKQTGYPVISVSQSMQTIAVYVGDRRHALEGSAVVLTRANQALATLERYKSRLDEVTATLSALEVEDFVTVRDVALVIKRHEMVRRISEELSGFLVELGTDGRLLSLQVEELIRDVGLERDLLIGDYVGSDDGHRLDDTLAALARLSASELLDAAQIAGALGRPRTAEALDDPVSPRGQRLLAKIPRLPRSIADRLIEHFSGLQALLMATEEDLMAVDGVGEARARMVREGVARLAESSILERYA